MNTVLDSMLARYTCRTEQDYVNALKEVMQELALLGLWRAQFFERAAFYGGTALRVLHGLDRFSEDLDFSLLSASKDFDFQPYLDAIAIEFESVGLHATVERKLKSKETPVESAFIKAGTKELLLKIDVPPALINRIQHNAALKIKLEIDTDPPGEFHTEFKTLLLPIPFSVRTFCLPDLFAGKVHALLERSYQTRVKGRDYYDFVWFVARKASVNLDHLRRRLDQSGEWSRAHGWRPAQSLSKEQMVRLLAAKFQRVDLESAKSDVQPFVRDPASLSLWSPEFFQQLLTNL